MAAPGQSHPYVDIIRTHPFFTIPGINPTSPIATQMEQIDQLNTLLLQTIDANFARVHQVITTRILPEIKRFALASEPTRRSAEFWHAFFLNAAGVGIPLANEGDSTLASQERTQYDDHTMSIRAEGSFMDFNPPGGASSTPLPRRNMSDEWEVSTASPYERMDERLRSFHLDLDPEASGETTQSFPKGYSPQSNAQYEHDASTGTVEPPSMTENYGPTPKSSSSSSNIFDPESSYASHSKSHAKEEEAPTPRAPARSTPGRPRPSAHLIDLTNTPLNARKHDNRFQASRATTRAAPPPAPAFRDFLDESNEDIMVGLGMSPPVTTQFALPPRASAIYQTALAPSPAKARDDETTQRLTDLLADISEAYNPSPRAPTPEGLRRYSIMPSDLGPGRRLFDTSTSAPGSRESHLGQSSSRTGAPRRSVANTSFGSDIQTTEEDPGRVIGSDESGDEDSFDSGDETMQMEAARIEAAQAAAAGFELDDDSFMSEISRDNVSVTDTHVVRPGNDASEVFGRPDGEQQRDFELLRQENIYTWHGGRLEDAQGPDSPLGQADMSSLGKR